MSNINFIHIIKLTLRGLSLFFKILPISNTGDSIAYISATVHFLYPKLGSFSDMEHYFYQLAYQDSKVPKRFDQMPLLTGTGANKIIPLHGGTSYTHDFRFYSKGNASATHQIAWAGSLKPQIVWAVRDTAPFEPPLMGGDPTLKLLFRLKGGRKTINFFSHFYGLVPDTNYKHLECFVMLGTHSEPHTRRGDISALRVKAHCSYHVAIYKN